MHDFFKYKIPSPWWNKDKSKPRVSTKLSVFGTPGYVETWNLQEIKNWVMETDQTWDL